MIIDKKEKKGITNKRVEHHQKTHRRTGIWWLPEEYEQVQANAKQCGLTVSEYVRRCSLGEKITHHTDTETLNQLMKLGGLQKKMITDLRSCLAGNSDISKLITATDELYSQIQTAIMDISRR